MEVLSQIALVPIIVVIVYCVLVGYKIIIGDREKFIKFIPIIAGVLGALLGIIAFFAVPSLMLSDNILVAIIKGIASGLATTGVNQAVKQLLPKKEEKKEEEKKE
ncbi:MAG: phage holin family protein [Firmicutes bacterium]|nr:phage holin family protein [Bacillota bacterium]